MNHDLLRAAALCFVAGVACGDGGGGSTADASTQDRASSDAPVSALVARRQSLANGFATRCAGAAIPGLAPFTACAM